MPILRNPRTILEQIGLMNTDYTAADFNNFPPEINLYRLINLETYKNVNQRKNIDDWKYVMILSSEYVSAYKNENQRKVIISVKGATSITEQIKAIKLATNNIPYTHLNKTDNEIELIKSVLRDYNFLLIGHSLGGLKIMFNIYKHGGKGIALNPYIPNTDSFMTQLIYGTPTVSKYIILGDMLSNKILNLDKNKSNVKLIDKPNVLGQIAKHSINSFF